MLVVKKDKILVWMSKRFIQSPMKKLTFLSLYLVAFAFTYGQNGEFEEKKIEKIQKRQIDPNSKFLHISGGFAFTSTYTKDPNKFLKTGAVMQNNHYIPNLFYEHSLSEKHFLELGYEFGKIGINLGRQMNKTAYWGKYSSFLLNHTFLFGTGYRLIGKNKFHYLNFHAGLFFGISNKTKSEFIDHFNNPRIHYITEVPTNLNYQIQQNLEKYSRISFGPYIGISHDFRLSTDVHLFIKYVHRFGLNPILSGSYIFSENLNLDKNASFQVKGGGAYLTGGLKIRLFKNNY